MEKKNFNSFDIMLRFKDVKKVMIEDKILDTKVTNDLVAFYQNDKFFYAIDKSELYTRWLLIDGVLHYIKKVNNFMGGSAICKYIKAEI